MKHSAFVVLLATGSAAALAQTAPKPAAPAATVHHTATSSALRLPPGVPVVHGILHTAFSLRYQEIKIGTGAEAEPNKLYKVQYTGYRASDGKKFDSSYDHRQPVMGKDGKPELDADGKPKLGDPQPLTFPQGMGKLIPGFDQGFYGMKVGGKRRIFIPWQLGYGTHAIPDHGPDHPGIPAKSDLIFDVELVDVVDMPMRPGMPPGVRIPPGGAGRTPGAPPAMAPGGKTPPVPGSVPNSAPPPTANPAPGAAPAANAPAPTPPPTTAAPATTTPQPR